jgi:imidazolonepropionase-like amidohydrolase
MNIKLTSGIASPVVILVLLAFCPDLNAHGRGTKESCIRNWFSAQPNRTVVIEGDHIQSIATGQADRPPNAEAVDMHGQTIMPLIINTHGHLGMVKGTSSGVSNQNEDNFRHQLLRYQDYGIGAVLSMGTDGPKFAEIREASRSW